MENWAIVQGGTVINVVVWDGDAETWQPPEGSQAVQVPDGVVASIGYTYANGAFTAPASAPSQA